MLSKSCPTSTSMYVGLLSSKSSMSCFHVSRFFKQTRRKHLNALAFLCSGRYGQQNFISGPVTKLPRHLIRNLTDFWGWETERRNLYCLPKEILHNQTVTSGRRSLCGCCRCRCTAVGALCASARYQISADRWLIWRLSTRCLSAPVTVHT